jgi:hypothetical protein
MRPIARRKTTPLKALAAVAAVTLAGAGPQALAQTIFVKGGTLIDGTGAAPTKDTPNNNCYDYGGWRGLIV